MDISNTKSLNVEKTDTSTKTGSAKSSTQNKDSSVKFADELKNAKKQEKAEKEKTEETQETKETKETQTVKKENDKESISNTDKKSDKKVDEALNGLNDTIDELNKLNQKDEFPPVELKKNLFGDDKDKRNKFGELGLIDNNMNIQEPQDKLNLQTGANMNFNSDGKPFTEFVNQEKSKDVLQASAKDLAEEKAIMSTMEENIAIANKNMALAKTKTVENEHGVHKIDKKSNLVVDTIVSYESVVMDKADVEFFADLVENNFLNFNDVKASEKASRVSKTLLDLLNKAMNDNKPIRIDFDNNISVIIKIDRAGKISADFLPSSQVAEAYLKENLPLLKQRFDENNIEYNELNQRQRNKDNQENRKKGQKDE